MRGGKKNALCYRAPEFGWSSLLGGTFLLLSTGQDLGPTYKTRYLTRMQADNRTAPNWLAYDT